MNSESNMGATVRPPFGIASFSHDHAMALGFLDLLEIRAIDGFINAGISWKTLRQVHDEARKWVGRSHPFCTNKFTTDGQTIFMELREKNREVMLWDMR